GRGKVVADGCNETSTFTVQKAGTYYIKVSRQNFTEGDYVLDPVESDGEREMVSEPAKVSGTFFGGVHHRKAFLVPLLATPGNGAAPDAKYSADFEGYSGMKWHRGDRST